MDYVVTAHDNRYQHSGYHAGWMHYLDVGTSSKVYKKNQSDVYIAIILLHLDPLKQCSCKHSSFVLVLIIFDSDETDETSTYLSNDICHEPCTMKHKAWYGMAWKDLYPHWGAWRTLPLQAL